MKWWIGLHTLLWSTGEWPSAYIPPQGLCSLVLTLTPAAPQHSHRASVRCCLRPFLWLHSHMFSTAEATMTGAQKGNCGGHTCTTVREMTRGHYFILHISGIKVDIDWHVLCAPVNIEPVMEGSLLHTGLSLASLGALSWGPERSLWNSSRRPATLTTMLSASGGSGWALTGATHMHTTPLHTSHSQPSTRSNTQEAQNYSYPARYVRLRNEWWGAHKLTCVSAYWGQGEGHHIGWVRDEVANGHFLDLGHLYCRICTEHTHNRTPLLNHMQHTQILTST